MRTLIFGKEATPPAKSPEQKNQTSRLFEALLGTNPLIGQLIQFLSACYHVFDAADPAALTAFIQQYQACDIGPLVQYATGLANDYDAVKNSLIYPEISNGPLEGVNSRIKMKHRRAGGRAGMELLNAYNVLRAENLTA